MSLHAILLLLVASASAAPLHAPQLVERAALAPQERNAAPAIGPEGPLLAARAAEPAAEPQSDDWMAGFLQQLQDATAKKADEQLSNSFNQGVGNVLIDAGNQASSEGTSAASSGNSGGKWEDAAGDSNQGNDDFPEAGAAVDNGNAYAPGGGGSWRVKRTPQDSGSSGHWDGQTGGWNANGGNNGGAGAGEASAPSYGGVVGGTSGSSAGKREADPQFGSGWGRPGWHRSGTSGKRDAAPQFSNGPGGPPHWYEHEDAGGHWNGPSKPKRDAEPQFGGGWGGRPNWHRGPTPKLPKREPEPQFGGPVGPPGWQQHDATNGEKGE